MIQADYRWSAGTRGGLEALLRFGPADAPTIFILPPLFEEANRTRRILVETMRALAETHGIASVLPDLPGTGDSLVPTVEARLSDWAAAIAAVAALLPRPRLVASIRGGALLDGHADADFAWRLAPEAGARLMHDLVRATALSAGLKPAALNGEARLRVSRLAGNPVHPDLYVALADAVPPAHAALTTVRLEHDPLPSDRVIAGAPVWRRAEPTDDPALVAAIVSDLANWTRQCAAR